MSMTAEVNHICKCLCVRLKNIASVREYLTVNVTKKLATTLLLSRLDYCNSLLGVVTCDKVNKLQRIQNHAAKLVKREKRLALAHSLQIFLGLH